MIRLRRSLVLFCVLAVVELAAISAAVAAKWPQPGPCGTDCPGSPVTLTYSFQNMFEHQNAPDETGRRPGLYMPDGGRLPDSLIRASIEEALGLWASVAPLHFVEVPDDTLPYHLGSTQFGRIRFSHIYINGPDPPPPAQPIAKARAHFPSLNGDSPGDVEFDHGDPWQEVGTLPVPDVLGAAIHELGHSLGLGHTNVVGANMYWIFHRFSGPGSGQLFQDDINRIRGLYGSGVGSVTPLGVPEPASVALLLLAFVSRAALGPGRRRLR